MLATLSPQDRVKLMAVDLTAVEMNAAFVAPDSREMQAALLKLDRREPLGSTDMAKALKAACDALSTAKPLVREPSRISATA